MFIWGQNFSTQGGGVLIFNKNVENPPDLDSNDSEILFVRFVYSRATEQTSVGRDELVNPDIITSTINS